MADLGYGRGWLNDDAAASLRRIDGQIGHPLQITSAGRTRAEQQAAYDRWLAGTGSYAAYPGTSPHEFGNAIDTNERLVSILADHGWWRPLSNEPWHFVYRKWADNHINDATPSGEEEDMTPEQDRRLSAVFQALFGAANVPETENPTGQITWLKPNGENPGAAQYGLMDISIYNQKLINDVLARPAAVVTDAQVKAIADAVAAQVGKPTVTLDYAAIAKAVNDEAAKRLAN